jgi:hypothetical protein
MKNTKPSRQPLTNAACMPTCRGIGSSDAHIFVDKQGPRVQFGTGNKIGTTRSIKVSAEALCHAVWVDNQKCSAGCTTAISRVG